MSSPLGSRDRYLWQPGLAQGLVAPQQAVVLPHCMAPPFVATPTRPGADKRRSTFWPPQWGQAARSSGATNASKTFPHFPH
jgi:hypothetical protein